MFEPIATALLSFTAGFAAAWQLKSRRMATERRPWAGSMAAGAWPLPNELPEGPLMPEAWYEERRSSRERRCRFRNNTPFST